MKKLLVLSITFIFLSYNAKSIEPQLSEIVKTIKWSEQASVSFMLDGKQVYIDPYKLTSFEKADLIFITHSHSDHLSIDDIKKIVSPSTKIYAPESCNEKLNAIDLKATNVVPGESITNDNIDISMVPAYNITKSNFHSKSKKWVGYVLESKGVSIYHPGDTERIPEMKDIDCDIAFMPLGQTYTMNSIDDAVQSILDVKAEVAIPFHYGTYEGTKENATEFKKKLEEKVEVVLLDGSIN